MLKMHNPTFNILSKYLIIPKLVIKNNIKLCNNLKIHQTSYKNINISNYIKLSLWKKENVILDNILKKLSLYQIIIYQIKYFFKSQVELLMVFELYIKIGKNVGIEI
jgi:hypothetical protein